MSKLTNKCTKVNKPKWLSYLKSPQWVKCKNEKTILKNVDDRCFQYPLYAVTMSKRIQKRAIIDEFAIIHKQ